MANKNCLSEKNKKLLKEIRERRAEREIRMKILGEELEKLKQRVQETNKRMMYLL